MEADTNTPVWEDNVILVDADWLDKFVFNISVNFERVLERPIPKADLARWVDYVSLDGGLRPGDNSIQVVLISEKGILDNCVPQSLAEELDGQAVKDNIGEFLFSYVPVERKFVTRKDLYVQSLEALLSESRIQRLMLIPDIDEYGMSVREVLARNTYAEKNVTVFAQEPLTGFRCSQEILTYSILATLGISSDEFEKELNPMS